MGCSPEVVKHRSVAAREAPPFRRRPEPRQAAAVEGSIIVSKDLKPDERRLGRDGVNNTAAASPESPSIIKTYDDGSIGK